MPSFVVMAKPRIISELCHYHHMLKKYYPKATLLNSVTFTSPASFK
jgi:hypothetical protein